MKKLVLLLVALFCVVRFYGQITVNPQSGCVPLNSTLTAPGNCGGAFKYKWYVNEVLVDSGATVTYNFTQVGYNSIRLEIFSISNSPLCTYYESASVIGFSNISSALASNTGCLGDRIGFNLQGYFYNWNNISVSWDFGDGTPVLSGSSDWAEHIYNAVGNYTITAVGNSSCGTQTITYPITISTTAPMGNVYLQAGNDSVCPGDLVEFYSPIGGNNFLMDYGDGTQEVGGRNHSYSVPGTYIVKGTFFNGCGSSTTAQDTVVVTYNVQIPSYINYFEISDTTVCPTTQINFYPPSGMSAYVWNFGDGTTSTVSNPTKTYSNIANYNVTLTVTNGCGYSKTITRTVYVQNNLPVDPFSIATPDSVCPNTSVLFLLPNGFKGPDAPPLYFNFGDGNTSTVQGAQQITHPYTNPGTYVVSASVINGCGQSYTYTTSVVVNSLATIGANSFIAGTPLQSGCPNDSLFFIVSPPDIGTILYDFGDGSTSTTPNSFVTGPDGVVYAVFKHPYQNLGVYNPTVQITSQCGSSLTLSAGSITISTNNAVDNDAGFFFDESKYYCLNEPINFFAYGASTYLWDFGDGSGSTFVNASLVPVSHAYSTPGTYTIKLTMRNGCGAVDTFSKSIFIPDSRVTINTSTVSSTCHQKNGKAIAVVSGNNPPYTYSWTNGDHNFIADTLTAGIYYVTITDSKGCSNFAVATVADQQAPTISVNNVINANCYGQASGAIDITLIGSSAPYTYTWSNGRTTEDINQLVAGPYEVIVIDANGCKSTKSITVSEPSDFTISYVSFPSLCGFNTGVIQTSVQGSSGPYSYLWSNGYTGASVSGLAAGIYSLTVVDSKGCLKEKTTIVNEKTAPIAVVDSISTLDCSVGNSANVYVSTYVGSSPYTYHWSNATTTEDLLNTTPGTYSLTVTGVNGCKSYLTTAITESVPAGLNVCAVTVDSLTHTNKIIWEMYNRTDIASFNIYRESSQSGLYYLVGNVSADSLHQFIDPSADPSIRGWRYKLSTINSCGEESVKSDFHKTIHLTLNQGIGNTVNLIWDNYEGLNFNQFYVWRYTTQMAWEKIDSLPANLFSYTDLSAPSPSVSPDLYYFIEGGPIVMCDPTRGAINTTRSNIKSPTSTGQIGVKSYNETPQLLVYPNPAQTTITLILNESVNSSVSIDLYNTLGELIYFDKFNPNEIRKEINVNSLGNGIYFLKMNSTKGQSTQRIIITK